MARYERLPIWNDAMQLAVHLERCVARFPRYHKYALGTQLRRGGVRLNRAGRRRYRHADEKSLQPVVVNGKMQFDQHISNHRE